MPSSPSAILSAGLRALAIGTAESAERVPNFDVGPTCRGATRPEAALRDQNAGAARETCFNQENRARDELQEKWAGFPAEYRASCVKTTDVGGIPSYVQLQTCLESRLQAEKIKDERNNGATTTGGHNSSVIGAEAKPLGKIASVSKTDARREANGSHRRPQLNQRRSDLLTVHRFTRFQHTCSRRQVTCIGPHLRACLCSPSTQRGPGLLVAAARVGS